jgi:hypothetical protein
LGVAKESAVCGVLEIILKTADERVDVFMEREGEELERMRIRLRTRLSTRMSIKTEHEK